MGEYSAVCCEDTREMRSLGVFLVIESRRAYMIVVISGGDRLSSKRSLSASASSILISGRPGIMVSVFVFVSLSWPVEGVYSSAWISGSSCSDM